MRLFLVLAIFFLSNLLFSQQGDLTIITPDGFDLLIQKKINLYKTQSLKERIGYRIQLFNGKERQEAIDIKYQFNKSFPGIDADIIFETPEWKTVVGYYNSRSAAERVKKRINKKFQNAIIRRMKFKRIKLFDD